MKHIHRWASRFLLCTQPLLLLAFCDFAARLYDGLSRGEVGIMLRLGYMLEHIIASAVILYTTAMLLNYLEAKYQEKED